MQSLNSVIKPESNLGYLFDSINKSLQNYFDDKDHNKKNDIRFNELKQNIEIIKNNSEMNDNEKISKIFDEVSSFHNTLCKNKFISKANKLKSPEKAFLKNTGSFTNPIKFVSCKGRYEGQAIDYSREGYGCMEYSNHQSVVQYKGDWKNDQPNGHGEITYRTDLKNMDGIVKKVYCGNVKNGMPDGEGKETVIKKADEPSFYEVDDGEWDKYTKIMIEMKGIWKNGELQNDPVPKIKFTYLQD